jgi:hypothetical protein
MSRHQAMTTGQVCAAQQRFLGMRDEPDAAIGYFSRVVGGLVACAVVAVTLHAEVATAAILVTVLVLSLAATYAILRGAH